MLAAYFVADGEAPAIDELREFLRSALPAYMVPAFLRQRWGDAADARNAKVDRRAVQRRSHKSADTDRAHAPRAPTSRRRSARSGNNS